MYTFINLRNYTDYTLGKSIIKIEQMTTMCEKKMIPALGIADKNNLFGSLEFSLSCQKKGIQPIIGLTLTIKLGLNPLVLKTLTISPINKHDDEFSISARLVSLVLSIRKDGKNKIKSLILLIPIAFNLDLVEGPTDGKPSRSLSSKLYFLFI